MSAGISWLVHLRDIGIGAILMEGFRWFYPNRKDWEERRKINRDKRTDRKVLGAISDFSLWRQPRPMTGAGVPVVRSAEIAKHLSLEEEMVADSLERLLSERRVIKERGTLDDPSPLWHDVPR